MSVSLTGATGTGANTEPWLSMMAMTFSPFWCFYPEKPMPSPPFWPRCWSHRHGARGDRAAAQPRDAAPWPQTPARASHHLPIWQRLCRRRVVNGRFALRVVWHRQALPLHPGVEHPQDEVKDAIIAQFALRSPLGHREVWQDKCGELRFGELDGNWRRYRLWWRGAHDIMASYEAG